MADVGVGFIFLFFIIVFCSKAWFRGCRLVMAVIGLTEVKRGLDLQLAGTVEAKYRQEGYWGLRVPIAAS